MNIFIQVQKHPEEGEGNRRKSKENYQRLDPSVERKYMTDKEILEKYIDLDKSCLMEKEKKEVMDMLYKYKGSIQLKR